MENHRRLWRRLVSRFRCNSGTYSYIPRSSGGQIERRSVSPVLETIGVPGRYTRFAREPVRTRPQLWGLWESTNRNQHPGNLFRPPFGQNLVSQSESFTPKCLVGLNTQNILLGQATYDDFSPSCWLENHLHRFGELQTDTNSGGNEVAENANFISSVNDSQPSSSRSFPITLRVMNNRAAIHNNTYSSSSGSHMSGESHSTVSDITHFYNSMNLTGFAFNADSLQFHEPPPYSELPEDPPPPYTEHVVTLSGRTPSNLHECTSTQLLCQDILW